MFDKVNEQLDNLAKKLEALSKEHPVIVKTAAVAAAMLGAYKLGCVNGYQFGYNESTEDWLRFCMHESAGRISENLGNFTK